MEIMNITNKITDKNYTQWIEDFVKNVIVNDAHIKCEEIVIDSIEPNKRIFIFVDGEEYTIRTWNYQPTCVDSNGFTCEEMVIYTLYKIVGDEHGSCGNVVFENNIKIKWNNDAFKE